MEYFILRQDLRYANAVEPVHTASLLKRTPFQTDKTLPPEIDEEPIQLFIKENQSPRYLDFIEGPAPLVSDRLKEILGKYEPGIFFKPVVLADQKRRQQTLYWWIWTPPVDCLSGKSVFNKNGTIRQLVIDGVKAAQSKVFQVAGLMEDYRLIRLDVAESLLRRDFSGIQLQRVTVA
jgi:hypothetical protein